MVSQHSTREQALEAEVRELRWQLEEAQEAIEAVRSGQVDALVIIGQQGAELYGLRTADLSYRMFVEGMKEGALTLSDEGTVVYANQQFALLSACPMAEVLGRNFLAFFPAAQQPSLQRLLAEAQHQAVKAEFCIGTGPEGVHVQLTMAPMKFDGQTLIGVLVTDLTAPYEAQQQLLQKNEELAQMNAALEASNHDLQQFASVASHDLQEPLRKIQLFANRLLDHGPSSLIPDQQRFLEKIAGSAARMKTLVVDVLNYSRLSAAEQMQETVDLNQLIQDLLDDFEVRIQELSATVQVGPLPALCGNPGQMRQVFQNLLSNGLKFAKPGQPPVLQIEGCEVGQLGFAQPPCQGGPFVVLRVRDNGIGFEQRFAQRIFSLFERLHGKDQFEGSGIGLAITKKIVEKHRGIIRAISQPGMGTCFELVMPKVQPIFTSNPSA